MRPQNRKLILLFFLDRTVIISGFIEVVNIARAVKQSAEMIY